MFVLSVACIVGGATSLPASDLVFKQHDINPESEYSAAAAVDVNRDGKLDIFCGGFWYEAPHWERHFVRHVKKIRGRYDGYSHLAMDVNGDGWTDIINVNYRSRSIFWVEHPGESLGPWTKHIAVEPGPMETGRLFDIDGDGVLDVLPNGVRVAAWWAVVPGDPSAGKSARWIQHDLPKVVAGHGLGFGDVNGDGRADIVGPKGWLEAPEDRRNGTWTWHAELDLGRASIPMLIEDPDGDGDNDIIYSNAHGYGLYWLEQTVDGSKRAWHRHVIDESWSQAHALLWEDLDSDGVKEIVTGKRYMAHDGRDDGAFDPLVIYRYQFDRADKEWKRHVIAAGGRAGFGLDSKVTDMDGDGDLDLVVSGRSGLYLLENTLKGASD